MAGLRRRRTSRAGRGRRATGRGRRSRRQWLRTVRVQRRRRKNLRARDGIRRRQRRTPGLRGGVGRDRRCGGVGRWGHCRGARRRRICGGAGRVLHRSLRAVASAHSRRDVDHTREHEHREDRCRHDGCAHDAGSYDKGLVCLASVVVTRGAALRPRPPEALGVPRRAELEPASAGFRERFGARQEVVIGAGHDSNTCMCFPVSTPGGQVFSRSPP